MKMMEVEIRVMRENIFLFTLHAKPKQLGKKVLLRGKRSCNKSLSHIRSRFISLTDIDLTSLAFLCYS
jgi:hypothetical protein